AAEQHEVALETGAIAHAAANVEPVTFIEGGQVRDPLRIARNDGLISIEVGDLGFRVAGTAGDPEAVQRWSEDVERQRAGDLGAVHVTAVRIHACAEAANICRRLYSARFRERSKIEILDDASRDVGVDMLVEGLKRDVALVPEILLEIEVDSLRLVWPQVRVAAAATPDVERGVATEADAVVQIVEPRPHIFLRRGEPNDEAVIPAEIEVQARQPHPILVVLGEESRAVRRDAGMNRLEADVASQVYGVAELGVDGRHDIRRENPLFDAVTAIRLGVVDEPKNALRFKRARIPAENFAKAAVQGERWLQGVGRNSRGRLPDWRRKEAFDLPQRLLAVGVIDADLDRPNEVANLALDLAARFLEVVLGRANLVVARLDEAAARPALDVGQDQGRIGAVVVADIFRTVVRERVGYGGGRSRYVPAVVEARGRLDTVLSARGSRPTQVNQAFPAVVRIPQRVPTQRILLGRFVVRVILNERRAEDGAGRDDAIFRRRRGPGLMSLAEREGHFEALLVDIVLEVRIEAVEGHCQVIADLCLQRGSTAETLELVGFEPGLDAEHALGAGIEGIVAGAAVSIAPRVPVACLIGVAGISRRQG